MRQVEERVEAGLVTAIILLMALAFFAGALFTQVANSPRPEARPAPTGVVAL